MNITSKDSPTFNQNDCEIIKKETLYQGIFRLVRYHLRHQLYNGGKSNVLLRDVLERQSAIAILPYDPVLDQVVLIEQFRPGPLSLLTNPWLIEVVAGLIDTDETPADIAIRESFEEAGCRVEAIHPIYDFFVSPGGSNEYLYLFCGKIKSGQAGGVHGLVEENEDIRAFVMPAEEAFESLRQGKIKTTPAIVALQWLQLNRAFLQKLWLE